MPRSLDDLDLFLDPMPDLHAVLAHARRRGPVLPASYGGMPASLFVGYDEVARAFADETAFPSAAAYSLFAEPVQGRTVQCMTGEEHRVNRALVSPSFRPATVRAHLEELIRPATRDLAAGLGRAGVVDLVEAFTRRLPFLVITRLLGLPEVALADLRRWADALFTYPVDPQGALAGSAQFTRLLAPLVAERRNSPAGDLLSLLATARVEGAVTAAPAALTDEEIFSFARLLFPAGADTTYRAIGSMLLGLLSTPGAWEEVGADEDARRRAVEEALRWEPPVALQPRRSVLPTTWGEVSVPAGCWLLFAAAAANRDPAVHAEPDRYDIGRPQPRPVLTFGGGPHYCLGAHLARAEMLAVLDVLPAAYPGLRLAVPPVDVAVHGSALRGPAALPVHMR